MYVGVVEYACRRCHVVEPAGRIQNSYSGLGQPEAAAVIVTVAPEPCGMGEGGENDAVTEGHDAVSVNGSDAKLS
jgi:hypothetical protein